MEKVLAMHQSGFGASASPNRGGAASSGASRAPKMTMHGPTRRQVLIPLDTSTAEVIVANTVTAVKSCNRGLVEAHSKLRVELVRKAWDGISMSTNFVASAAKLKVIKQWLKKVAGSGAPTKAQVSLLATMQCKAAFWILSAFCTSPTGGIEALAGLIPIHLHLKKLAKHSCLRAATLSS